MGARELVDCRGVAVVYASAADDGALAHAVALARDRRVALTIAVPVARPAPLAALAYLHVQGLRPLLEHRAWAIARRAASQVSDDVPLVLRCVPRAHERRIVGELAGGAAGLCLVRRVGRSPDRDARRLGRRLARRAAAVVTAE